MAVAVPPPGGKTIGASFGAGAAVAFAKDFTVVTIYATGIHTLPQPVMDATTSLLNGFYGATLAILGLYLGHLWNKANASWGNGVAQPPAES